MSLSRWILLGALAGVACGCSRKPVQATLPANVPAAASAAPANAGVGNGAKAEAPHGSRKKKNVDVPVMIDGALVGTLRFGELPPGLQAQKKLADRDKANAPVRYYRIADYLKSVGVSLERVRSVHARGNLARIASVEGDELRREPGRFVFDFLEGTTGIAKTGWDTTGLRNTFRIDEIRELLVYVDRESPVVDAKRSCYLEGSACSEKIPYAEAELAPGKGTRVYLDGKLVGQVKRRRLTDDLVVGTTESGSPKFALAKLLSSVGVDLSRAKLVELVAGDDVIGRGGAGPAAELTFVLPKHQSGRVLVSVPSAWQSTSIPARGARDSEVTAVLVFSSKESRKRDLTPIPDAPSSEAPALADQDG